MRTPTRGTPKLWKDWIGQGPVNLARMLRSACTNQDTSIQALMVLIWGREGVPEIPKAKGHASNCRKEMIKGPFLN